MKRWNSLVPECVFAFKIVLSFFKKLQFEISSEKRETLHHNFLPTREQINGNMGSIS